MITLADLLSARGRPPALLAAFLSLAMAGLPPTSGSDLALVPDDKADGWRASPGAPPAAVQTGAAAGIRFRGDFGTAGDRLYWDHAASADLRGQDILELEATCLKPDGFRTLGLYLKSGPGWYLWLTPLSEAGRQRLTFSLADAATEGRPAGWDAIDAVRFSLTRGPEAAGAEVILHRLRARTPDLVLVRPTLSMNGTGERFFAAGVARRVSRCLQEQGIAHSLIDDEAVIAGRLAAARLAILPYNPHPPDREVRALESFLDRGGKLAVFYCAEPRLAARMGLKLGRYQSSDAPGRWNSIVFNRSAPARAPRRVWQDSSNILPALPDGKGARVIATWHDSAGRDTGDPAWTLSPHGAWMSHVLLEGDLAGKQRMLLALLASDAPGLWEQAARRAIERAGRVGPFDTLEESRAGIAAMARGAGVERQVTPLLARASEEAGALRSLAAKRRFPESVEAGERLQDALVEAFARAQAPKTPEFRGVWDHGGLGLYPGDWPRTARLLRESGLKAVFVNALWAGRAHYPSLVVQPSAAVARHGDVLKSCTAAAAAEGLHVHLWKVCWNLSAASAEKTAELRKAGQDQQIEQVGKELRAMMPWISGGKKSVTEISGGD